METLIELMKKLLADEYAMYLKTQNYHWNVEGPDFPQYHAFFGDLYAELAVAIDQTAEQIRALGAYAPGSFKRFAELTEVEDELNIPQSSQMVANLIGDNQTILDTLLMATKLAENFEKRGLVNFLEGRLDIHSKHAWMLKSIVK
jgi:starvation-inducible DNA-binding protein